MNELINEILKHKNDKGVLVSTLRNDYEVKHPKYTLITNIRVDKATYHKLVNAVYDLNGGDKNGSNE